MASNWAWLPMCNLGAFSTRIRQKPGIIFEVAYLEGFDCAREKTQKHFCTLDEPRPSVVVQFKFLEMKASRDECEDMTLESEVHRCDPEDERMTVIFETGVATSRKKNGQTL